MHKLRCFIAFHFIHREKWSKQKIMGTLKELWDQNTKPIKMPNLCRKTNRFVAAGIFFELMGKSKRVNFYAREKSSRLCFFFLLSVVENGSR